MANLINDLDLHSKAEALTEASIAIRKGGGFNYDSLKSAEGELKAAGLELNDARFNKLISLSQRTDANDTSVIGQNTFMIENQLIQDYSPENQLSASPFNTMLPFREVGAFQVQQDIINSAYGNAQPENGVNGANTIVPLLGANGKSYEGLPYTEVSYIEGEALNNLRKLGTDATAERGWMQRWNLQRLMMLQRQAVNIELQRCAALGQGVITYKNFNYSMQIPSGNVTTLSQSLGSYVNATNVFTANASMTVNPLREIGVMLTSLMNMGLSIEKIEMDNICYGAIFNSSAVQANTQYMSAVTTNDIMKGRDNLFRITTIPELQGVPIEVYNGSWKIADGVTSTANTRPLMWGPGTLNGSNPNYITSSSFRAVIVTRPTGMSRIGDLGFFPNQYARNTQVMGGSRVTDAGGGIVLIEQDLSAFDILNQKVQMVSSCKFAPMLYLPNGVFVFDFNVSVS